MARGHEYGDDAAARAQIGNIIAAPDGGKIGQQHGIRAKAERVQLLQYAQIPDLQRIEPLSRPNQRVFFHAPFPFQSFSTALLMT